MAAEFHSEVLANVVYHHDRARLVRVNPAHPEVPDEIADRSLTWRDGAAQVLAALTASGRATGLAFTAGKRGVVKAAGYKKSGSAPDVPMVEKRRNPEPARGGVPVGSIVLAESSTNIGIGDAGDCRTPSPRAPPFVRRRRNAWSVHPPNAASGTLCRG